MGVSSESLFTDDSMLRRVIREQVVGLSGPRALLMQAAHPVAFAGFFAHTGALDEPYERLSRTARVLDLVAFGAADDAPPRDAPRARHAPPRARRARRAGRALRRPARRTRPTTRRCCCGSSPRWPTRPPSSTSATSPR